MHLPFLFFIKIKLLFYIFVNFVIVKIYLAMKKLKTAILWHQHQPYYKYKNEFILPWVRFHGVKDYYDLPALLCKYPNVRQTFNLVPALMLQIENYINNSVFDKIQRLTLIPASELNNEDKHEILNNFFVLNYDNLLSPFQRYRELFLKGSNKEEAINSFTDHDWLDLQVLYNLAWIGPISKTDPFVDRLIKKGQNYTEVEKVLLLDIHRKILSKIVPIMSNLKQLSQIDISCSPMYHPILPLLIDSESTLERMPLSILPNPIYRYYEDAKEQVEFGINYYEKIFNNRPKGMWPSEGSISNKTLDLLASSGIKWTATDEDVLFNSLSNLNIDYKDTYKYFPYKYKTKNGNITLFFRDHQLSDKIGFTYSTWNPFDAACNFRENLFDIRSKIINNHGEDALDSAVVSIILDGENCWEFYPNNGYDFLNEFFKMLSTTEEIETVLFSEQLNLKTTNYIPELNNICAGSWINSNFSIWIGDKDDLAAWNMLSKLRAKIEELKPQLNPDILKIIMGEIYIAEGSDWFWWYGPEHNAEHKQTFDEIFRWRIAEIYKMLNIDVPQDVLKPIGIDLSKDIVEPQEMISPKISGDINDKENWSKAGVYSCNMGMSTMHQIGELVSLIRFGYDKNAYYFRLELVNKLQKDDLIEIKINELTIRYYNYTLNVISNNNINIQFAAKDTVDFSITREELDDDIKLSLSTKTKSNEIRYKTIKLFN